MAAGRLHLETIANYVVYMYFLVSPLVVISQNVASSSIVNSLPGFPGPLPFKLETGYIGVDENEDVQLFYYFIESEGNPKVDPLLIWLTGGPGCSGLNVLVFEIGPMNFNIVEYNGSLPTMYHNPHSWSKVANLLFMDSPVGTGYSYSKTLGASKSGDALQAYHLSSFIKKWLQGHPYFTTNPLYIAGDSYSGIIVPIVTKHLFDDSVDGQINLKGYVIGNPLTDVTNDINAWVPFAHSMALITDEMYQSVKEKCHGNYFHMDPTTPCGEAMIEVLECTKNINTFHVLEPYCPSEFSVKNFERIDTRHCHDRRQKQGLLSALGLLDEVDSSEGEQFGCRDYQNVLLRIWANDKNVQKALHVRKGKTKKWIRCNLLLPYSKDTFTVVRYHEHLNAEGLRALIYSGDHDMTISHIGTRTWIKSLNLTNVDQWRPWTVDGQIGGYVEKFSDDFTFATVKGGGHTAPEYQRKECLAMIKRWISEKPL